MSEPVTTLCFSRRSAGIIISLSLFFITLAPVQIFAGDITYGKVISVIDGDTLIVEIDGKEEKVRLIGVDCPELHSEGKGAEFLASEAKDFMEESVLGKKVSLRSDIEDSDVYGRKLRYVFTEKGFSLNEELLKKGLALVINGFAFREKRKYLTLQSEALNKGRGLFTPLKEKILNASSKDQDPLCIYRGPARTYIITYRGLAKVLVTEPQLASEIRKVRIYNRRYGSNLRKALLLDGYIKTEQGRVAENFQGLSGSIPYKEAGNHVGEHVTVAGKIVRTNDRGNIIFLDFDRDWKHNLSLVIFKETRSKFSVPPHELYLGKFVKVTGKVQMYKGKPEIIIKGPGQIEIIDSK